MGLGCIVSRARLPGPIAAGGTGDGAEFLAPVPRPAGSRCDQLLHRAWPDRRAPEGLAAVGPCSARHLHRVDRRRTAGVRAGLRDRRRHGVPGGRPADVASGRLGRHLHAAVDWRRGAARHLRARGPPRHRQLPRPAAQQADAPQRGATVSPLDGGALHPRSGAEPAGVAAGQAPPAGDSDLAADRVLRGERARGVGDLLRHRRADRRQRSAGDRDLCPPGQRRRSRSARQSRHPRGLAHRDRNRRSDCRGAARWRWRGGCERCCGQPSVSRSTRGLEARARPTRRGPPRLPRPPGSDGRGGS